MKNSILAIGTGLTKVAQQEIRGGYKFGNCKVDNDCCHLQYNQSFGYICNTTTGVCEQGVFSQSPCGL